MPEVNENDFATEQAIDMTMFGLLVRQAAELKECIKSLEDEAKARKAAFEELQIKICQMMLDAGIETTTVEGINVKPKVGFKYFRAAGLEDEVFFEYLRANNLGDIIKPTVNFKTLDSAMNALVDNGGQFDPSVINQSPYKAISLRKTKGAK
ncbi:MAG: hypothetical protein ABFD91_14830 [Anaerohalosphaeraceae bacterium]